MVIAMASYDLKWTCKCYRSLFDCEADTNELDDFKVTISSDDTDCHKINDFSCDGRDF